MLKKVPRRSLKRLRQNKTDLLTEQVKKIFLSGDQELILMVRG
ncbi:MAG: hypothetical protein UU73_C0006G0038 [Candidatus Daviesbacteria bacterium GW2011_GWA1_41_61]|uniref:Uncharacterized protein n=1 Tax=Candidatus Daviesbacteria bacterium GW2011_GWA2_40_9 TaxID=1618424 RepID=A0A0G0X474_9BACT|nr:MAG: hypothetical protein UU26_C0030G0003 [Candidatus Daviesbacteria bacterium GW2011_GWC1_40_9]KKR82417.1 MAG: hypothetical protein UU29_C0013G0005 [Candidatus Daviesbacteria bacterium GW2011_GWA2_40_9]KKR92387.1 MAG: hypothetical protein UU44_C0006G0038 [Candidatus Daviesbacteria bacterium GW2011_GWB1_41_15]KKS14575.1 MAG: hypothetical protein UU73_C0006G0038 [Candidatus Daviesbacteria bacterium GW2011_GWA1_41_61]